MKRRLGFVIGLAALFMLMLATTVMAQGEPPAPYAGLKNPFPWTDSSAQAAGLSAYKQSCLGCHGISGDNLAAFDFSKADFAQGLKARPDFYFWVLSEGRMDKGMPAFKSLSEQQRWQVLTYLGSLAAAAPSGTAPSAPPVAEGLKGILRLTAPEQTASGQAVTLKATFDDEQGKPVANIPVKFYLNVELFTTGLVEIGQAVTDEQGVAILEYTPRQAGAMAAVARYGASEARATVSVSQGVETTYETEAGIHFPTLGGSPIIYPKSVLDLGPGDAAPLPAFRLPGGIFSWLFILVGTVFMIWFTYFRVMYQIFRIPIVGEIRDVNTRLMPTIGMAIVITIGVVLILKLLISPWSHLHIPLT